jgi:hypothetical protein
MKLTWKPCPCGHKACKRMYPVEIGWFYAGSGFDPDERKLMDEAFAAVEDSRDDVDDVSSP